MKILLEHTVSLRAPITLDVNLDALSRIHTSHYSMFKFWVKDAALTLVSVFAARWRPTQIVISPYACSIYNSLILIPLWTHQFMFFFLLSLQWAVPAAGQRGADLPPLF